MFDLISSIKSFVLYAFPELVWVGCLALHWVIYHYFWFYVSGSFIIGSLLSLLLKSRWIAHYTPPCQKTTCCICLEPIQNKTTKFAWCSICKHTFHDICFQKWDLVNSSCPICRREGSILTYRNWTHGFNSVVTIQPKLSCLFGIFTCIFPTIYVLVLPLVAATWLFTPKSSN